MRALHQPLPLPFLIAALLLFISCNQEPPATTEFKLFTAPEAPPNIQRHPAQPAGRVLYVKPQGWGGNTIELSFYVPSFLKPLPRVKGAQSQDRAALTSLDPWRWERTGPTQFRFWAQPSDQVTVEISGRLRASGNQIRIAGDLVNHLDEGLWEEIVGLNLNFVNAPDFADPDNSATWLYPEDAETPSTIRELLVREKSSYLSQPQYLFWTNHPNEPRHRARLERTGRAGGRRIVIEGEPLLCVSGDTPLQNLGAALGIYAKAGQASHFEATVTFEEGARP